MKPCVFLFSEHFEGSFIVNEVLLISEKFEKVYLISSTNAFSERITKINNIEKVYLDYSDFNFVGIFFNHWSLFLKILIPEFFTPRLTLNYAVRFPRIAWFLLRAFYMSDKLDKFVKTQDYQPSDILFLSFWFNNWATVLSICKKRNIIKQFFSRAHGGDLFEERERVLKRIPFRSFQLEMIDKVFSVSQFGTQYLQKKYPHNSLKVDVSYLGTADHGIAPFNINEIFTVISCSGINRTKRLHLIPEILMNIDFPLHWVHFGWGDQSTVFFNQCRNQLLTKPNIELTLLNKITNDEIFNFYKTQTINLFISVSQSEGLPVSMMEAISFGIPILGTDVGGCAEIINKQTGILIERDFNVCDIATIILNFKNSYQNSFAFRNNVRLFWKGNYSYNNYNLFYTKLAELSK